MLNKRAASLAMLLLGAVVFGAVSGSGCAIHRGDRNTVQPLALDKKQFQGEWYYLKTVINAPYDAVGMFPGSQSGMTNIRWEITENFLYAFASQPSVRNADSTVVPIAAWPIIGHFTIRYRISYATGQPSNVVGEDYADRPWYQRPHFRVAWERSVITDFTGSEWYYRMFGYFVREMPTNVRPEEVQIQGNFMDVVNEEIISPGIMPLIGKLNTGMPISAYRIRFRHSFKKVESSTYTAHGMNDDQFAKFGYFRTALINYHIDRGLVDWSYHYVSNRHNVATAAEIKAGTQKPKQITYYLSPDFPKDMKETAYLIGKDWNRAFQRALNRPGEEVFVIRDNGYGLPQGQTRQIGDIRYNFLYWVPEAISFGLLGYGPSFADINTGEIIQASAYVYGATVRLVANRFLLLYDMISGRYSDEDLRNGKDYLDIISNFTGTTNQPLVTASQLTIKPPAYKGFDVQKAHEFIKSPVFSQRTAMLKGVSRAAIQSRLALIDSKPSLKWAMMPDETLASMFPRTDLEQLRQSQDQQVQEVLNSYLNPGNMIRISSIREIMKQNDEFSRRNMMLENYVDPAMSKFVESHIKAGTPRDKLYTLMQAVVFRGTEAHEIGHTLGLRHNFEGSADEPNYFPQYFELKNHQGGNIPGTDNHFKHRWFYMYSSIMDYHGDVYGDGVGIGSYDHAAIMYAYGNVLEASTTLDDTAKTNLKTYITQVADAMKKLNQAGGNYEGFFKDIKVTQNDLNTFEGEAFEEGKKAVMFDTNQVLLKVEGVEASTGETKTILQLTADDLSGLEKLRQVHSLTGIRPRAVTPQFTDGTLFLQKEDAPLQRRFYRFCSDELVGQSPYCTRFDSGSNPKEMVENMIRRYDGNYPLRNWNRGRRYYRLSSGYFYGLIGQFSLISLFYQNWIFRVVNENGYEGSQDYFNQLAAIERGVTFINRVIQTPEPGRHILDKASNSYVQSNADSTDSIDIPMGVGRYFYSKLQEDELGLAQYRFERIGTMYDKYVALMALAIRDWGLAANSLNFFYVNFADYFSSDDVTDMFTQAISGIFDQKRYSMTANDKILTPNWHPVLQYTSMLMAVSMLNNGFFGNTFSHYMTVGITGSGQAWTPPKQGSLVSFNNAANTRQYFAVQTEDGRSIAYKLVARGRDLALKIKELRALPTSAVNQAELKTAESQLVWVETVLQMMKAYVNVFFEDN